MNKRKPKEEKQEPDIRAQWLNSETGRDFIKWWRNHRHSGYATNGDRERWGILPYRASSISRYIAEYCSDRKLAIDDYREDRKLLIDEDEGCFPEYTAKDYEQWAIDQKRAVDAAALFGVSHGGREVPTLDELSMAIRELLQEMGASFNARSEDAKQTPEPKYWDKGTFPQPAEGMTDSEVSERKSKLADQVDEIHTKWP